MFETLHKTLKDIWKCLNKLQKKSKIPICSETLHLFPNASKRIRTHPNRSEWIRMGPNASTNIKQLLKTCKKFQKVRKTSKKIQVPFSIKEVNEVLSNIVTEDSFESTRNKLIVALFYSTGMRRTELIQLKMNSINFSEKQLKTVKHIENYPNYITKKLTKNCIT